MAQGVRGARRDSGERGEKNGKRGDNDERGKRDDGGESGSEGASKGESEQDESARSKVEIASAQRSGPPLSSLVSISSASRRGARRLHFSYQSLLHSNTLAIRCSPVLLAPHPKALPGLRLTPTSPVIFRTTVSRLLRALRYSE